MITKKHTDSLEQIALRIVNYFVAKGECEYSGVVVVRLPQEGRSGVRPPAAATTFLDAELWRIWFRIFSVQNSGVRNFLYGNVLMSHGDPVVEKWWMVRPIYHLFEIG